MLLVCAFLFVVTDFEFSLLFIYVYVCLCGIVCTVRVQMPVEARGGHKIPENWLQGVVSHRLWGLGTELESCARAVSVLIPKPCLQSPFSSISHLG